MCIYIERERESERESWGDKEKDRERGGNCTIRFEQHLVFPRNAFDSGSCMSECNKLFPVARSLHTHSPEG